MERWALVARLAAEAADVLRRSAPEDVLLELSTARELAAVTSRAGEAPQVVAAVRRALDRAAEHLAEHAAGLPDGDPRAAACASGAKRIDEARTTAA